MDRAAIEDLYSYLDFAWQQIVQVAGDASEELLLKPVAGSGWPTLRNCLAHYLFAYERWLTVLTDEPQAVLSDTVKTLAQIDAARSAFRGKIDSLLAGLSDEELQSMRTFIIDGEKMPYSYVELLSHVALHERGHHGDVTTLLWQLGIEAPTAFDYRFHLGRRPV